MQGLPQNFKLIFASTLSTVSLEDLCLLTKLKFPCLIHLLLSFLIIPPPVKQEQNQQIADLQISQINQLTTQLQVLSTQLKSHDLLGFHGHSCSRSPFSRHLFSPLPSRNCLSPYCWYREHCGTAPLKCNPPCTFLFHLHTPVSQTELPQQSKELHNQPLAATSPASSSTASCLFYITDCTTGTHFLTDTVADVSVIPPSVAEKCKPASLILQAVNKSTISTFSQKSMTLNIRPRLHNRWIFINVYPFLTILRADFHPFHTQS